MIIKREQWDDVLASIRNLTERVRQLEAQHVTCCKQPMPVVDGIGLYRCCNCGWRSA